MFFKLNIQGGNAAFGESALDAAQEVARILKDVGDKLSECVRDMILRDYNGNRVGVAELSNDNLSGPISPEFRPDFSITVRTADAAFFDADNTFDCGPELSRILLGLAENIHKAGRLPDRNGLTLRDENGNRVGVALTNTDLHTEEPYNEENPDP